MATMSTSKEHTEIRKAHRDDEEGEQNAVKSTFSEGDDSEQEEGDEVGDIEEGEAEALKMDLGSDAREGKRRRPERTIEDDAAKSVTKDQPSSGSADIWKEIQTEKGGEERTSSKMQEMVRIIRTYRFAGEEVKEEKLLPASDPEAKAYLLAEQKKRTANANAAGSTSGSSSTASKPVTQTGPRKRKIGGLAAMSAAATAKPAKLNTLEKSKMDWTSFKDKELGDAEKHQLDAQTKGGGCGLGSMKGYMERRDFLERVQDRLDGPPRP